MALKPSDVFVPGRFPVEANNIFADRGVAQRSLEQAWDRAFVPIVFGSYGVGKSSLAFYCAKNIRPAQRLVYVESLYGKSLPSIFERILEEVGYEVSIERTVGSENENGSELGFEAGGGFLAALTAKFTGKISRKQKKAAGQKYSFVVKSPTDGKLLDICEENGILLLLDEVHRASDNLREDLSAFLKAYANRNCKRFRIGLVGTEIDASRLIIRDPGIDRLLQEIQIKPITTEEARAIIVPGMNSLNLAIDNNVDASIIKAGVGSPFIVQYLCLEMAENAISDKSKAINFEYYKAALHNYALSKAQRMIKQYRCVIETTGVKRYRKQILMAMAKADDDYVTMEKLTELVSSQLGEATPSTALSGPLRSLKQEEFGKILSDIEATKDGARAYNYSVFTDPAMKSVIRLVEELEAEGNLPADLFDV